MTGNLTPQQSALLSAIYERLEEIGKPRGHVFGQGELTWLFIDGGYVMVSRRGQGQSGLYNPQSKFSEALQDLNDRSK